MAEPAVSAPAAVDFADMQGLLRFGHGRLSEACFLLLEVADREAACVWLLSAPVTSAQAIDPPPSTALQVAFTCEGLRALGVDERIIQGFADEFTSGMAGDPGRSRRLGDVAGNAPSEWAWGGWPDAMPHLLLMLYARPGGLAAWETAIQGAEWERAFRLHKRLPTFDMGE
ncbi:MAG: putative peroxidase, partial [Geminicoccaceae bacterium]|nr:putative peroxidase [Geminicoccaceae bacterium]